MRKFLVAACLLAVAALRLKALVDAQLAVLDRNAEGAKAG